MTVNEFFTTLLMDDLLMIIIVVGIMIVVSPLIYGLSAVMADTTVNGIERMAKFIWGKIKIN